MSQINLNLKPQRSSDIVFQLMPPETILLNLESGYYYSTNRIGNFVWEKCDGKNEIGKMIEELKYQFDVSCEQLTEDVIQFIQHMLSEGLLKIDGV